MNLECSTTDPLQALTWKDALATRECIVVGCDARQRASLWRRAMLDAVLPQATQESLEQVLDAVVLSDHFADYVADAVARPTGTIGMMPPMSVYEQRARFFGVTVAERLYRADLLWVSIAKQMVVEHASSTLHPPSAQNLQAGVELVQSVVSNQRLSQKQRRLLCAPWRGLIAHLVLNELIEQRSTHRLAEPLAEHVYTGAKAILRAVRRTAVPSRYAFPAGTFSEEELVEIHSEEVVELSRTEIEAYLDWLETGEGPNPCESAMLG